MLSLCIFKCLVECLQTLVNHPPCQEFLDVCYTKVWVDHLRCHDPSALHWLASLGYGALLVDFGIPDPNSPILKEDMVPSRARVPIEQAKEDWLSYWRCQTSLSQLFDKHGNTVVLLMPDSSELNPLLVAKVQRDMMEMTLQVEQDPGSKYQGFKLGILATVTKFPKDDQQHEDIRIGLHMAPVYMLHIGLWPWIQDVAVLRPTKNVQVGVNYHKWTAAQLQKFMVLVELSPDPAKARDCVRQARKDTYLNNDDNEHQIYWGTLRSQLDYLDHKIGDDNLNRTRDGRHNYFKGLLPTWHWVHVPFPDTKIFGTSPELPLEEDHWRFSLDFSIKEDRDHSYQAYHRDKIDYTLRSVAAQVDKDNIDICNKSRRSAGNHGQQDRMEAWDVCIKCPESERGIRGACSKLASMMYNLPPGISKPTAGTLNMMNLDRNPSSLLAEATHSKAFFTLAERKQINWVYYVNHGMAIVDPAPRVEDLKTLQEFIKVCQDYNKESQGWKVSNGGTFIERVVLGKKLLAEESIKKYMTDNNMKSRVFWDRNEGRSAHRTSQSNKGSLELTANDEVLVTLGNAYSTKRDFIRDTLVNVFGPFIIKKAVACNIIDDPEAKITWTHTQLPQMWKIKVPTSEMADWLSTIVIDMPVAYADTIGNLHFQSKFFPKLSRHYQAYFANIMIKDVEPDWHGHQVEEPQPQAPQVAQGTSNMTAQSTEDIHGSMSASSSTTSTWVHEGTATSDPRQEVHDV